MKNKYIFNQSTKRPATLPDGNSLAEAYTENLLVTVINFVSVSGEFSIV
jgi:hypothetical protein